MDGKLLFSTPSDLKQQHEKEVANPFEFFSNWGLSILSVIESLLY